jgi:hypothetical protein
LLGYDVLEAPEETDIPAVDPETEE